MQHHSVSVLMTVLNGEPYIRETIESILNQTFRDFEFIIIDDGSTDATRDIIQSYTDPRIVYHYHQNAGTCAASNTGLSMATGKYIARIDADDISMINRLQVQYDFMETHPEYVLCASIAVIMDKDGNQIFTLKAPADDPEIRLIMEREDCIVHPSTFFHRTTALKVGGYYEPIRKHFEDFTFLYQLMKHGKAYIFQEPLLKYRLVPLSLSIRARNIKYRKTALNIVKRGYAHQDELDYIFTVEASHNLKKTDKLYNYYLLLAKLYRIEAKNWSKAIHFLLLAIRTKPFEFKYLSFAIVQITMPRKLIKYIRDHFN